MPHVSYANPVCPWGCGFRFDNLDFRLELGGPYLYKPALLAWHSGLSLVGPCPGCSGLIAFDRNHLQQGLAAQVGSVALPADWFTRAEIA